MMTSIWFYSLYDYVRLQFSRIVLGACLLCGTYGCASVSGDFADVPLPPAPQNGAVEDEKANNYLAALKYWKSAEGVVQEKISLLSERLEEISKSHSEQGEAYYQEREGEKALREFLDALRYDPSNATALEYLKKKYKARESVPYTVQEDDTFETIADTVYGSQMDTFAVALYSGAEDQSHLVAGSVIHLPLLSTFYSQALLDYKRDILLARQLFKKENYNELLPLVEKILQNHPGDQEALYLYNSTLVGLGNRLKKQEMYEEAAGALSRVDPAFKNVDENIEEIRELQRQKMLKDAKKLNTELFREGEVLVSQRKYLEALEVFKEVDRDFEGIENIIANVKEMMRMQADIHYKRGVKFFVEDNLAAAIGEWKKTLSYEPDHDKAKSYIEKATKLLEKVEAIN